MLLAGELVSILFSRSEFGCNEVYYMGRADMGLMVHGACGCFPLISEILSSHPLVVLPL